MKPQLNLDSRVYYKYHLKMGDQILLRRSTFDLERSERYHQIRYPGSVVVQIGRRVSVAEAFKWERSGGKGPSE